MGWNTPDVYHQPEAFGLTILGSVERYEPDYSFDFVVVWYHEDGSLYFGADSGCSCPSPFEDYTTLDHLQKINNWMDLQAKLDEYAPHVDDSSSWYSGNRNYTAEAAELVLKAREVTRG